MVGLTRESEEYEDSGVAGVRVKKYIPPNTFIGPPDNPDKSKKSRKRKSNGGKKKNQEEAGNSTSQSTSNPSERKTPYQGPFRTCGMFHCQKCKKDWFSANSWANCYQRCNGCKGNIYPYKQFRPERSSVRKEGAPRHPQEQCQKCMMLGHSCVGRYIHNTKKEDGDDYGDTYFEREE